MYCSFATKIGVTLQYCYLTRFCRSGFGLHEKCCRVWPSYFIIMLSPRECEAHYKISTPTIFQTGAHTFNYVCT